MSKSYQIAFLAGVPATGKSTYCKWLEEKHGFIHIDVENNQTETKDELRRLVWADPNQLIEHLRTLRSNVIIDQGFVPQPEAIKYLKALKNQGVSLWWFNAGRETARKAFEMRNDEFIGEDRIDVKFFDDQMDRIENTWDSLKALFDPNILETLLPDMSRLDHQTIYKIMFPRP